jgi:hypothetical protein
MADFLNDFWRCDVCLIGPIAFYLDVTDVQDSGDYTKHFKLLLRGKSDGC